MIVAVSDFNMGAMENKGLNVFNDKYVLASPETATDSDFERIEAIIAHEYFHNWTGNRITCRDWFQLCLKEGLTVFRDQEFTADERSRAVKRIRRRARLARPSVRRGRRARSPIRCGRALYHEINNFYTATVYEKGAEVVRMLKTLLGPGDIPQGHGSLFRAPRRRGRDRRAVRAMLRRRLRRRPHAVHALVLAGRHARGGGHRQLRCARQDLPARRRPDGAADARPAEQGADGHPARDRPGRARRPRPAAEARRRADDRARRAHLDQARGDLRVRRYRRAAGALAQPRLFGADQARRQPVRRRPAVPGRARHRSVQSLAGGADARDASPGRQRRELARGEAGATG